MAIPAPVIDPRTSLLAIDKGRSFHFQPVATGNPTEWVASGLPAGLSINTATNLISGTPTEAGVFAVLLEAANYDSRTFTVDEATDELLSNGHSFANDDEVTSLTTGTLPAPLTGADTYFVRDSGAGSLKLAATLGGPAIDLTDIGTGVHTLRKKQTDQLTLIIPVLETGSVIAEDEITIEIDVDLVTGAVAVVGVPEAFPWGPPDGSEPEEGIKRAVLLVKKGDRFPVAIGFRRNGILQDLAIETLLCGIKEYEPERLFDLTDSNFEKIGSGNATRYKTTLDMTAAAWAALLSNYETDEGTYLDAFGEVQFTIIESANDYDQTQTDHFSLTGGQTEDETFNFAGLPLLASADYTVDFDLTVPTRPGQNVSLQRTFTLAWDGNAFSVSNITGDSSGQGADESPHWRTTLANLVLAGTANGVDVATRVTTTDPADEWQIVIDVNSIGEFEIVGTGIDPGNSVSFPGMPYEFQYELEASDDPEFGPNIIATFYIDDGNDGSAIRTSIETADAAFSGEVSEVRLDADNQQIIVVLTGPNDLFLIEDHFNSQIWERSFNQTGDTRAASVAVRIAGDAEDSVWRKTSQTFKLRIERDLIPEG